MKVLLFVFVLFSYPFAANRYVDFFAGNDNNSGLDINHPWKHCPGDSLFDVNGEYIHEVNDTIFFKGGVHYKSGSIKLRYSNIAYVGSRTWGSGKPIINGGNFNDYRRYGFKSTKSAVSDVMIDNFAFTRQGGAVGIDSVNKECGQNVVTGYSGFGILINSLNSNITIKNCRFYELGWWQTFGGASLNNILGYGIAIEGGTQSLLIDSCEFEKVGNTAIGIYGRSNGITQNIEISNCNIHSYIRWGIDIAFSSSNSTMRDIRIHGNILHDFTAYDYNGKGHGHWIDTCTGKNGAPHTDMITLRRAGGIGNIIGGDTTTSWRVYNNEFYTNDTVGGGTALIFITFALPGELWIYNNVVKGCLQSYGFISSNGPDGGVIAGPRSPKHRLLIANNTTYQRIFLFSIGGRYLTDSSQVEIYNNIWAGARYSDWSLGAYIADSLSLPYYDKIDYNLWYTGRGDSLLWWLKIPSADYYRFNRIKDLGFESHGIFAKPGWVDTSYGLGMKSSFNDLHLVKTSPARNKGKNLSNYFTHDKDGNPRPLIGAWDIGAYQYNQNSDTVKVPTPTGPPTRIRQKL